MRGCPPGCSPTGARRSRREIRFTSLSLDRLAARLRECPGRDMAVRRAELVRQALELDLIDELRLTIIPTPAGGGDPSVWRTDGSEASGAGLPPGGKWYGGVRLPPEGPPDDLRSLSPPVRGSAH